MDINRIKIRQLIPRCIGYIKGILRVCIVTDIVNTKKRQMEFTEATHMQDLTSVSRTKASCSWT